MPDQAAPTGAVFLSYASQDAEAAARICETLRAAGVEVWFDRSELRGGDAWDSQIKKQIHDCALFLPIISAHTNARTEGYFRREWKLATRRLLDIADDAAFLVPVVIDDTRDADARVPEEFLHVQWTRLPGGETSSAFAQRVRQLVGLDPVAVHTKGKAAVTGAIEPSARSPGFVRPHGTSPIRRFELPLIALLLVLGGGAFWYFQGASDSPAAKPVTATAPSVTAATPNEKSIAVLPFVDMSAERNQEYMADGIADELLNLLAQAPDLKVIARTSSFAFKGQNIEIAEIAKKLNVAHVLEGSVRKSGNKLRITAQLIRTADSTHLWSESYDRPLDDIFAVQDEIANAIVQVLQIKLMGESLSRREGGTQNLEAYQMYLQSVAAGAQPTKSSLVAAQGYAEQATKLDPNYGRAWFALATTYSLQADTWFEYELPPMKGYERARELVKRALQISPDLAEAHALLSKLHRQDLDWAAAKAEMQRAIAIDPTNLEVLVFGGGLSCALGHWDEAERQYRAILVRDPLNFRAYWNLGRTYYLAGRFEESEAMYRKLLDIAPDVERTRSRLGKTLLAQGKPEAALAIVQQATDDARLLYLPVFLQAAGRQAEADEALNALIARWDDGRGAYYVALAYSYRGDYDLALEWLDRAYEQKDPTLVNEIVGEHLFRGMANDPRYKAFLRKMKLPVDN